MRIAIQTLGTRGDVQPCVALGIGLQNAGYEVVLAASPQFRDFVEDHGLTFAPLPGDLVDLIQTPLGKEALSGGIRVGSIFRLLRAVWPMFRRLLDDQWAAAAGADAIIFHPKAIGGASIAEKLGIPAFVALPLPGLTPTRAFASPVLPFSNLGWLNRASFRLTNWIGDLSTRSTLKRWRREVLGLSEPGQWLASRGKAIPVLYPFSPSVVAAPADWDGVAHVTGYWFLDEGRDWIMPDAVRAFLADGPPPVYVGFGSLPSADAARLTGLVIAALDKAGCRGVLATGWGGLQAQAAPGHVHFIDGAPHERLFPLMSAVVHHGGAGTTAAGLRAGRPSLICPFFGDQPFWGRRVHALGAGPKPIPQRRLSVDRLAAAIAEATTDPAMAAAAHRLADAIEAEDGVGRAVEIIAAAIGRPDLAQ